MASLFHFNFIPNNAEKCRPRGIKTNRVILPWNYPFGELNLSWKLNFALSQEISDCLMWWSRMVTSSIRLYFHSHFCSKILIQKRTKNVHITILFQNSANHIISELRVLTSSAELQNVAVLWRTSIKCKNRHVQGVQKLLFLLIKYANVWCPRCRCHCLSSLLFVVTVVVSLTWRW